MDQDQSVNEAKNASIPSSESPKTSELSADSELGPWWNSPHVLFREDGRFHYTCSGMMSSSGPWDRRPKRCGALLCNQELIEESVLDSNLRPRLAAFHKKIDALTNALKLCRRTLAPSGHTESERSAAVRAASAAIALAKKP